MKASEIMSRPVITAPVDMPVREAAALLAEHRITSLPVVDEDGDVIGIVSEVDLLRARMPHDPRAHLRALGDHADPPGTVGEVMSESCICLSENADAAEVAEVLVDNRVRAVPILRGGNLVGIVSRRDVLRTLLRDDSGICADVRERLAAFAGQADRWHVTVEQGVVSVRGHFADDREKNAVRSLAITVPGVVRVHLGSRW
jgi:CBS domain-containing protein